MLEGFRTRSWFQCATRHGGSFVKEYEFCLCTGTLHTGRLYFRGTCGSSAFQKTYKVLKYHWVSNGELSVRVFDEDYESRSTMHLSRIMEIVGYG